MLTPGERRMVELNSRLTYKPGYKLSIGINPGAKFYNAVMTCYVQDSDGGPENLLAYHKEVLGEKRVIDKLSDKEICLLLRDFIIMSESHEVCEWIKIGGVKVIDPHTEGSMYTFKLRPRRTGLLRRIDPRVWIAAVTVVALLSLLALTGCNHDPIGIVPTNNYQFRVEKLFDVKGCEVYRFYDGGYSRYFTLCEGSVTSMVNCGKNCYRTDEVQTKKKPRSCNALEH